MLDHASADVGWQPGTETGLRLAVADTGAVPLLVWVRVGGQDPHRDSDFRDLERVVKGLQLKAG